MANAIPVTGTVSDMENGNPVEGVNIIIKELQKGCITDKRGKFTMPDVPDGKYTIIASYMGYHTETQQIELSANTVAIKFRIEKEDRQIDEVVVASERYEYLQKVPSRIDIIQAEIIEIRPENDITGVLENMSGVNVENTMGIYSGKSSVSLRGLSSNDQSRTLILLDDIPLNTSDGGSVNWNMIVKENIESIEVMKGCSSPKYGSNAIGGTINIVSKKPSEPVEGFAKASYGTYNTLSETGLISGNINSGDNSRFYWSALGSAVKSDGYVAELIEITEVIDSIVVPVNVEEYNSNIKLGYLLNKKHNFEINASYYEDFRGDGIFVYEGGFSEHATLFPSLKYSYKHKNLDIKSRVFYLDEDYHRQDEKRGNDGTYFLGEVYSKRKDFGTNTDVSYTYGLSTYSIGMAYKQGSVDSRDVYFTKSTMFDNSAKMDILGLYIQDEIDFASAGIQLSFGLRYDYAKLYNAHFNPDSMAYDATFYSDYEFTLYNKKWWYSICPKFSVQKRFNENTRVYFSYGKGFKAPLLDDICRTQKSQGSIKAANPDLKPETIHNFETGVDYTITPALKIEHSAYFNIGNDFMYTMSTGDSVNLIYTTRSLLITDNVSKVHIYGIETDFEYTLNKNLNIYGNYTYNISQIVEHINITENADFDYKNKYLTYVPVHKLSAGVVFKNKIADVSLSAKYLGERWIRDMNDMDYGLDRTKFPAYYIVNARLHKDIYKGLSASADINNIFNEIYINKKYQRCPGRVISAQVTYKF